MKDYLLLIFIFVILLTACRQEKNTQPSISETPTKQKLAYATGFTIKNHNTYKEIKITSPWPDAKQVFTYILYSKKAPKPSGYKDAVFIPIPVERVVVTSTTNIPMLEYLDVEHTLIGFPHTDYISSKKTRALIDKGTVKELGNENALNTEMIMELAPELVIGFSATGDTKAYDLVQKTGIPVVMNGSWMEQHPLGRAEWIKFIAAFYDKEAEAKIIFHDIVKDYTETVALVCNVTSSPTVLSGTMYKDIWYIPGGNSYMAQFLKDAKTTYLWGDHPKKGSLTLSFESVLEKAQQAELWIGAGRLKSLPALAENNNQYTLFSAFENKNVYSSTLKTGPHGGLLYYELGPLRPDLILKDIIKIAHPEVVPDYESYFFKKLK